jgi:hypothetical protein
MYNLISTIGFVNADSKTVIQNEVDYTLSWQRSKAFTKAFTKALLVYCFIQFNETGNEALNSAPSELARTHVIA